MKIIHVKRWVAATTREVVAIEVDDDFEFDEDDFDFDPYDDDKYTFVQMDEEVLDVQDTGAWELYE
jgi:hypothetical protein